MFLSSCHSLALQANHDAFVSCELEVVFALLVVALTVLLESHSEELIELVSVVAYIEASC